MLLQVQLIVVMLVIIMIMIIKLLKNFWVVYSSHGLPQFENWGKKLENWQPGGMPDFCW